MRHPVTIRIPQPCSESWDAMTPTTAGRHCAACQKTVVDFTLQTDAEILAYLARAAGGRTCGRFVAGQLERPLQRAAPTAPTARWRAWLAAAVAVWGVREAAGVAAKAQAPVEMRRMSNAVVTPENRRAERKSDYEGSDGALVLRGVVHDYSTHEGLPGVSILIRNSVVGVATAQDGTFELAVPSEFVHDKVVELQIRYIGYVSQERRLTTNDAAQSLTLSLQTDVKGMMAGEVVVGYSAPAKMPPAPWHPRRFYYWGKYWLTRPFQRS
jgi:hypothetical protein